MHLDYALDLRADLREIADGRRIDVTTQRVAVAESSAGRLVTVELALLDDDTLVATQQHRFALRGRATPGRSPGPAPSYGGVADAGAVVETPRSFVDRAVVRAPRDMTPFAMVSGDYNPLHTSRNVAALVGLDAPITHGMWLSATAQHLSLIHI